MSETFKAITTQEEFDKAIQERLARQKESIEKQYADYAGLKAKNTELETEIGALKTTLSETGQKTENYDKDIAELNAKIAGYETANMRTKIALQHGIPHDLASRLVGEDEKSITEDAKKLAELVKQKYPVPPLKSTEPDGDGKDAAYKQLLSGLKGE